MLLMLTLIFFFISLLPGAAADAAECHVTLLFDADDGYAATFSFDAFSPAYYMPYA